jgi:outer membrane immunogenic protein
MDAMRKTLLVSAAMAASMSLASTAQADGAMSGWHGFYVGAHGSYLDTDTDYANPATPEQSFSGAMLGIQAGFNFDIGPNWILGLEADISWGNLDEFIRDGNFLTEDGQIDTSGTLRARLGYLASPDVLLYATGGLAWNELEQGLTCPAAAAFGICAVTGAFDVRSSETFMGWVVGGGVEFQIAPKWSLKAEAMAGDYGSADYTATVPVFGTSTTAVGQNLNVLVQFGVNYHFN